MVAIQMDKALQKRIHSEVRLPRACRVIEETTIARLFYTFASLFSFLLKENKQKEASNDRYQLGIQITMYSYSSFRVRGTRTMNERWERFFVRLITCYLVQCIVFIREIRSAFRTCQFVIHCLLHLVTCDGISDTRTREGEIILWERCALSLMVFTSLLNLWLS